MSKRRERRSATDDLLAIAVKLPWWMSLVIAVVSFVVLHSVAVQDVGSATSARDIGGIAVKGLYRSLANIGQYIVPALFLLGSVVSVLGARKRHSLLVRSAESDSPAALHEMTWREFEGLVQEAFRLQGYAVRRVGGHGADGGVDLVLDRGAERVLVQFARLTIVPISPNVTRPGTRWGCMRQIGNSPHTGRLP